MDTIYRNVAERTGGGIYIGVVGPVRTGKSTLIKRLMEELVIPCMDDPYRKERARDELPQSGSGRMIMTSEPKFVPEEPVEISPDGVTGLRLRMIDSVGYMVDGAVGAHEDGVPRMVTTPWFDHEIPMTDAAELGTKKVMQEHCSVGLVVTTDGSITDIPRRDYLAAEARAVADMAKTGKPFLVLVNSREPAGEDAQRTVSYIREEYGADALAIDALGVDAEGIRQLLQALLYSFPVSAVQVYLPRWLDALEAEHPVKQTLYDNLLRRAEEIKNLGQAESVLEQLRQLEGIGDYYLKGIELGSGTVSCAITFPEALFYQVLSSRAGMQIETDTQLLQILTELSQAKREYDKVSDAISAVKSTGYGVVLPTAEELILQQPQLQRKGGSFGVKLRAGAPSIHMIRVDVDTQISPMVGSEQQSQELIETLREAQPEQLGKSNIFGKSVYELLQEGLTAKLVRLPEDVREKFRGTLSRVVNEGATGLICLIL